jgi:hypothetical protein
MEIALPAFILMAFSPGFRLIGQSTSQPYRSTAGLAIFEKEV